MSLSLRFLRMQRELARQMTKMGCRASALEVYERLQLWEDAIECYQAVGRNAKVCMWCTGQLMVGWGILPILARQSSF